MGEMSVQAALQAAIAHHQAGRLPEAEALYRQILARLPQHPDALHLLGLLAHHLGRHESAVELINQALAVAPNHAPCHCNLGNALQALGRLDEAIASHRRALAINPDFAEAHNNLGNALGARGLPREAAASYAHALAINPDFAEAHNNLGFALAGQGEADRALACLERALALRPDFPEAHNNIGMVLEARGQAEAAIAHLERALALRPEYAEAFNNLGNALLATGRLDAAVSSLRRALALRPDYAEAHNNLGQALEAQGCVEEAIASYRQAQALRPELAAAHWNEALALLSTGDFASGWPLYEWRWQAVGNRTLVRSFAQPVWRGDAPLAGRTLFLHYEQGLGDTLQMLRYVPVLARRGARVIVEVPPALAAVAATLPGDATVVVEGEPLPAFDVQCPLMSLPLALQTTLASIPDEVPYLAAPEPARMVWRARLGAGTRRRIGLAWSGSAGHTSAMRQRSLPFHELRPLLAVEADFCSVQKEYREGDLALLAADGRIRDFSAQLADFADTAGLIAQLDLVISVDTAVAHLAGAMGKPVWLLLPFVADYRWMRARADSPWYPTLRLFRQQAFGDWAAVIGEVSAALAATATPDGSG